MGVLRTRNQSLDFGHHGLEEASEKLLARRGTIVPDGFEFPPKAKFHFAWIGVSCRLNLSGKPERALVKAVQASAASHDLFEARHGRIRRFGLLVGSAMLVVAGLVGALLGLEGIGGFKAAIVGLVLALLGMVGIVDPIRKLRSEGRMVRRDLKGDVVDLQGPMREASTDARTKLRHVSRIFGGEDIPVVVVIDDATWADDDTLTFVEELMGSALPVFTVATVRPDPFEQQVEDATGAADAQGFGWLTVAFSSRTSIIQLDSLTDEAMEQIILSRAGATEPSIVHRIARWASGNPLVLDAALEMPVIASSLVDGAYRLNDVEAVLAALPRDYLRVFSEYWDMLPLSIKQLLAIASYHGLLVQPHSLMAGFHGAFGDTTDPHPLVEEAPKPGCGSRNSKRNGLTASATPPFLTLPGAASARFYRRNRSRTPTRKWSPI